MIFKNNRIFILLVLLAVSPAIASSYCDSNAHNSPSIASRSTSWVSIEKE